MEEDLKLYSRHVQNCAWHNGYIVRHYSWRVCTAYNVWWRCSSYSTLKNSINFLISLLSLSTIRNEVIFSLIFNPIVQEVFLTWIKIQLKCENSLLCNDSSSQMRLRRLTLSNRNKFVLEMIGFAIWKCKFWMVEQR